MSKYANIPILNIYYMIAYAFSVIDLLDEADVAGEEFESAGDMLAFVFGKCLSRQIKRGLERSYAEMEESIPTIRGRVDVRATITPPESTLGYARCRFAEYCEDTPLNRVLKTTLLFLLRQEQVSVERKAELRRILPLLSGIGEEPDVRKIRWGGLSYHRNNRSYRFLMGLCYLILHDLINTEEDGPVRMVDFEDSRRMHDLYERFILSYFQTHYRGLLSAGAPKLKIDESEDASPFLPTLRTDVVLESNDAVLVIDAKYYSKVFAERYGKESLRSNNIAQIFQYTVLMSDKKQGKKASGMLLYAKAKNTYFSSARWSSHGHDFEARVIDLSQRFDVIKAQLDEVAETLL